MISDVSAIGRWSPNASDVTFDQGSGPRVGAWFSGRNHKDGRHWTARSPPRESPHLGRPAVRRNSAAAPAPAPTAPPCIRTWSLLRCVEYY
ncbi:hypothetical protein [Streptomyces erythrochromogenes]|uniref:hypothetical protein n=1 Tax=Streptomyces erythrochromogenes TaxID=285574 RepID=UPI0037FE2AF4